MKGHDVLLRAAARVAERLDHVNFVLVGKGTESESSVTDLVNTSGIGRRVHRLGERRDIATLLAAFDIVVSSSHSEGFPNVVGEAMSCGVPCVVSDVGDSATLLGGCGVVVPPRDSEQLALGILRVLAMESSARQAMGRRADAIVSHTRWSGSSIATASSILISHRDEYVRHSGICLQRRGSSRSGRSRSQRRSDDRKPDASRAG